MLRSAKFARRLAAGMAMPRTPGAELAGIGQGGFVYRAKRRSLRSGGENLVGEEKWMKDEA